MYVRLFKWYAVVVSLVEIEFLSVCVLLLVVQRAIIVIESSYCSSIDVIRPCPSRYSQRPTLFLVLPECGFFSQLQAIFPCDEPVPTATAVVIG